LKFVKGKFSFYRLTVVKNCSICKQDKPLLEFSKRKKSTDGLYRVCRICTRKACKEYYRKNIDKIKIYEQKNSGRRNERRKNKYKTNSNFRLSTILRARILDALKKNWKGSSTTELLGLSIEDTKNYLESLFALGMTWENHGLHGWHIDHIRPCSSFDLSDPIQQKACFHHSNLQPLWAEDNLKKSDVFNL
jgi:hypothetical protein